MKPYYEQDDITIYHGDCRDLMCLVVADCAITDPPYNVGLAYSGGDNRSDYEQWCVSWFSPLRELTKSVKMSII
jgi:DNA modification methylase